MYHQNSYLSSSPCTPCSALYLPDSLCTTDTLDTYAPISHRDMLDSTSPKTPPTSHSSTTKLLLTAHVPLCSKKLTHYLNWKWTAQKKVTHCPRQPATPFSAVWTAQHLYQDKPKSVLATLSISTHKKCSKEVCHETIAELNTLSNENVILALDELKKLEKYIWGTGRQQLDIKVQLQMLDDQQTFAITTLINSRCTSSCIDSRFIKAKNIATKKVTHPIPIYWWYPQSLAPN